MKQANEIIIDTNNKIDQCLSKYIYKNEELAILDFPNIKNVGDSAIWLGEISYLNKKFHKKPSYVCRMMQDFSEADLRKQVPTGPIFIHGGGNFGDIWGLHQEFREFLMETFPDRRIIQFPQSIHFEDKTKIESSARAIRKHGRFTLIVRDQESKEFSEKHFDCEVLLCPDMAYAIGALPPRTPSIPVLAMLREDKERMSSRGDWNYPDIPKEDWITESASSVKRARIKGWLSAFRDFKPSERQFRRFDAAAHNRFERGISQIGRARAIVTDRLHVHICSMLLGRPHAVLDNSYGKIRRFIDTFYGENDLTYRATSLDDAVEWARHKATIAD
jgi:exopolysaccharide biosynthesis predicted pyruvyltransferase EpsI